MQDFMYPDLQMSLFQIRNLIHDFNWTSSLLHYFLVLR